MKLALVIYSLSEGGAERVMSSMANHWSRKGAEVSLVTLDTASTDRYPLDPQVRRVALGLSGDSSNPLQGMLNNLRRVAQLRKALRKLRPEVAICFMEATNILTILATRGLGMKVVVMEHTNPEIHQVGRLWDTLRRWTYRFADRVGVLTERTRPWAEKLAAPGAVFVLPNPIQVSPPGAAEGVDLRAFAHLPATARALVSMGRLAPEKGFDLLIRAFAPLAGTHPDFHLVILGEGGERGALEAARASCELEGRVHLPGRVENPMAFLRQCDLFVMSSRYEGFPMALCEAMASGLPVISFDCPTGPGEIIRDQVDGILVPAGDAPALTQAMGRLMGDAAARKAMGGRGPEGMLRFSEDRIMAEWDRLLSELNPGTTARS